MKNIDDLSFDLKYRPRTLDAMVGNDSVKLLMKSLLPDNFPKFSIFTGYTGSGKTTAAFIIAMILLCEEKGDKPCFNCNTCKRLLQDLYQNGKSSGSLGLFMYDMGLNNEQEYINDIARGISMRPIKGNKVIILEELQRVKKDYQDALLRALEFIPENTYVIITTSEPYKLANALKSRATEFKFTYPTTQELSEYINKIAFNENILIKKSEIKSLISYYNNNPRQILKGLETVNDSDGTGLNIIVTDKREDRLKCFKYFSVIYEGMEALLDFIDGLNNKSDFVRSLKYTLKDTVRSRYKPITNITAEERDGFKNLNQTLSDTQIFELIDYLSNLNYINEEDAEVILLIISYKLSTKIQVDATTNQTYSVEQKGEDLSMDISNIISTISFDKNVVNLDDL